MTLQNNCDRVKMACLAQLVNVIAPIMTENGGKAWAQTIFYPFMYASVYGNGTALKPVVKCDTFSEGQYRDVPYVTASVVHDPETKELIVFAVNRSLEESADFSLTAEGFENLVLQEHVQLYCEDLKAVNTKDREAVAPQNVPVGHCVELKKHSWNMLRYCCG